jgi:hypothetical protein
MNFLYMIVGMAERHKNQRRKAYKHRTCSHNHSWPALVFLLGSAQPQSLIEQPTAQLLATYGIDIAAAASQATTANPAESGSQAKTAVCSAFPLLPSNTQMAAQLVTFSQSLNSSLAAPRLA